MFLCSLEEAVRDIDQEIKREQRATDEIVQAMPAAKQEKYFSIMATSEELLQVLSQIYHPHKCQESVSYDGLMPVWVFSCTFMTDEE